MAPSYPLIVLITAVHIDGASVGNSSRIFIVEAALNRQNRLVLAKSVAEANEA